MRKFLLFVIAVTAFLFGLYRWKEASTARHPEKYTFATQPVLDTKNLKVLAALDDEFTQLVHSVVPSVVSITTSKRVQVREVPDFFEQFFGGRLRNLPREQIENSLGSGVIVSKEGHILTNNHVIDGVDEIQVGLADGRKVPARLIGADKQSDLAVLKIEAKDLVPLPFGDSDEVQVGEHVIAVGNPFGFEETVTQGIISAKGRRALDSSNEYLQTDAAINPGNSGGPLINLRGEIIGINAAIYSTQKSKTPGWQGVGFAIPANFAKSALVALLKTGRVPHGYLGVMIQSIPPAMEARLQLPGGNGVLVTGVVNDSPAEKAGLQADDILLRINGTVLDSLDSLRRIIATVPVGKDIVIDVLRNGAPQKITAKITEIPDNLANSSLNETPNSGGNSPAPATPQPAPSEPPVLDGIRVVAIPDAHRAQLPSDIQGVMVAEVDPDAPASEVLQPGDVIEQVNRVPVTNPDDFAKRLAQLPTGEKILLLICRGGHRSFVILAPQ
jgi:serine protease Do